MHPSVREQGRFRSIGDLLVIPAVRIRTAVIPLVYDSLVLIKPPWINVLDREGFRTFV